MELDTAGATSLLIVEVKGNATATYYDEKLKANASFSVKDSMTSVVPSFNSGTVIGVTPLTTVAAKLAGVDTSKLGTTGFVPPVITAASLVEAGARTLLLLGLPSNFNLFAAPIPASITAPNPTDLYGATLARLGESATTSALAL